MTEQNIPLEQVSKETVSKEAKTQEIEQKESKVEQPQPSDERIQQLIAQEVEKARRQLQGEKDRAVAEVKREVERRARLAESRASAYESAFSNVNDEDLKATAETAKLKGETQFYQDYYQRQEQERLVEQQKVAFLQSLKEEVATFGLDPEDKSIDYADDASDYFSGRKRFTDSISKALKAKETEREKQLDNKWNQLEADFRKKHGLDSQEVVTGPGVTEQSDADFMAAFGAGQLSVTKENLAKYDEIRNKYY